MSGLKNDNIDVDLLKSHTFDPITVTYTERDVALYALGIGAARDPMNPDDLPFVYELHGDGMKVLPTMGVLFPFGCLAALAGGVPGLTFDPMMLLHGEQYLEVKKPIPTAATLVNTARVKHVYDKVKGAVIVLEAESKDQQGETVFLNEFSVFIRGIGGFGGDRGPSNDVNVPPNRAPDAIETESVPPNQALIYRLSGDYNPLHADPTMASMGGFNQPILHGLCTFGYAGRAVLKNFCNNDPARFKSIQVRFAKHVFPGETLITEMWKVSPSKVVFQVKVKERNAVCVSNACVEIVPAEGETQSAETSNSSASAGGAVTVAGFTSSALFEAMKLAVEADPALVKKVNGIFQFDLTAAGKTESWTADLKAGTVYLGAAKPKADATISITDENFVALSDGKLNPQKAFMQGLLKVKGNMGLVQKLELVTKAAKGKAKL
eukprot:TRINITY_DN563_c0_g1_i1.p1 TRINITY_DN563_c0_g1~~TRINITY_DN563_c0_g1_i1.p1  ORF type:complete len:436 (+),score=125.50 TRINITY_DN563_c0_g1_i1:94-1401(+)